ncbi:MAG: PH domain-containing protein [Candidatus Paceibacterota bacterium]|jgi:hypothetical protein
MAILSKSNNSFREQLPEENTILVTRKHWIILLIPMLFILLMAIAPSIIYHYFLQPSSWFNNNLNLLFRFLTVAYFLILWNIAFYNIMIYSLNTLVITNKRVIENKQMGFFINIVNEIKLDKVQDVSIKIYGALASFLNYGDIEVQSAGAVNKFFFKQFPNPEKIKNIILDSI